MSFSGVRGRRKVSNTTREEQAQGEVQQLPPLPNALVGRDRVRGYQNQGRIRTHEDRQQRSYDMLAYPGENANTGNAYEIVSLFDHYDRPYSLTEAGFDRYDRPYNLTETGYDHYVRPSNFTETGYDRYI
ncbi:hypothetical protein PoB_006253900 [Plakobranchus ocellatus]|uniref:Uncharacterized protein n=1 Tax=Plakobranchus ocellatus TaxID=259542 RepID=A0AAV4CVV8_9GAST|nr:hypothetical protein PoB_006253900 [Plakobranchus ocellatus]